MDNLFTFPHTSIFNTIMLGATAVYLGANFIQFRALLRKRPLPVPGLAQFGMKPDRFFTNEMPYPD